VLIGAVKLFDGLGFSAIQPIFIINPEAAEVDGVAFTSSDIFSSNTISTCSLKDSLDAFTLLALHKLLEGLLDADLSSPFAVGTDNSSALPFSHTAVKTSSPTGVAFDLASDSVSGVGFGEFHIVSLIFYESEFVVNDHVTLAVVGELNSLLLNVVSKKQRNLLRV